MKNDRQAILILGMHRSGTSAISGLLSKLGAASPKTLIPGSMDNEKGHFESDKLRILHECLLQSVGSSWDDWRPIDPAWVESEDATDHLRRLTLAVDEEFGDASFMVIKDPRVSRFVPVWIRVAKDHAINMGAVLTVRHPGEVAASLYKRNGFSHEKSVLVWLRHLLDAERNTRSIPRSLVCYDQLIRDWRKSVDRISGELEIEWPNSPNGADEDLSDFITESLWHHRSSVLGNPSYQGFAWAEEAYQAVEKRTLGKISSEALESTLDEIREDFDRSTSVFSPIVSEIEEQAEALAAEIEQLQGKMGEEEKSRRTFEKQIEALKSAHKQQLANKGEVQRKEIKELEDSHTQTIGKLTDEIRDLEDKHITAINGLTEEMKALTQRLEEMGEARIKQEAESLQIQESLSVKLAIKNQQLKQRDSEVAEFRRYLKTRTHQFEKRTQLLERRLHGIQESPSWKMMAPIRSPRALVGRLLAFARGQSVFDLIRNSELFDADWYLERNKDVAKRGMDPAEHYYHYGAAEGREPGPGFDTNLYEKANPGVIRTGLNPVLYHLWHKKSAACDFGKEPGSS